MDIHGTMADRQLWSLNGITRTWKSLYGKPAAKDAYRKALHRNNQSFSSYLREVLNNDDRIDASVKEDTWPKLSSVFNEQMKTIYVPMPGMRRVMRIILDRGLDVAVLTNGSETEIIKQALIRWKLPELAENLYNGPRMNVKKPKAEAVHYVLNDLKTQGKNFEPHEVLMVGDQFDDTSVAHNAGIDSVLIIRPSVTRKVLLTHPHPTFAIDSPFPLLDIVVGNVEPLPKEDMEITLNPYFFQ
jgi:phosphoglycolate phosphatase-like HAD superfamily hydrolase